MADKINLFKKPVEQSSELKPDLSLDFSESDFAFEADVVTDIPKNLIPNKTPKDELILFLQTSQLEIPYTITHNGNYKSAEYFIHRMRVELSRFRAQIIKLNKPLNHFHVLTKSIDVESEIKCVIILVKSNKRQRFDVLGFLTIPEE